MDPSPDDSPASVALVTGAAGWLGTNLVRTLAGHRDRIRCLVRSADEAPQLELLDPKIEVVVGDVRDPTAVDRLFEGVQGATVFHTAAVIHPAKLTREFFDVNAGGTENIVDRARRTHCTRFIHVSSNSPFGANPSPTDRFDEHSPYNPYLAYGKSKLEGEEIVFRAHNRGDMPAVILRAPWFYGPYQPERQTTFFAAIRKGRFPLILPGTQQRSMVYTGNLVQGLLKAETAAGAPGNAYWIADAEPYELRVILDTVRDALAAEGLPVAGRSSIPVPHVLAKFAAGADTFLQARGRYIQPVHVLGELKDTIACDISAARRDLGYEPDVALLDGMRASVRWCIERGLPI